MPQNRWYWIVLPYNVNVSEIKTSTDGGWNDLVFTEYNAQRRAEGKNGWINWKTEYTKTLYLWRCVPKDTTPTLFACGELYCFAVILRL